MRTLPIGFGLAVLALVGIVIIGLANTRANLSTLQSTSQENIFWSAAQVEREYGALQLAIGHMALDPSVSIDDVRTRFDILWSRVAIFSRGKVGARLLENESVRETHEALSALLTELDPFIANLDKSSPETLTMLAGRLDNFKPQVRNATVASLHDDQNRIAEIRASMRSGLARAAIALVLTIVVIVGFAIFAVNTARKSTVLAEAATEAAASRKKFFSVMSHEFRTPLNGMLGSLALMRDETDQSIRRELIDEAHGSAHRLSNLVADALDLSADDDLELSPTLFRLADLVADVTTSISPELSRSNAVLRVTGMVQHPALIRADMARLRNALSHLIINAVQRANAKQVRLFVDVCDQSIKAEIGTDVVLPHDAFGETLARGLIVRLGGHVEARGFRRAVSVPVELVDLSAKLYFKSRALRRMYSALLKANGIECVETAIPGIDIVLVEAAHELESASQLRERYPGAVVIVCGVTASPELYDGVTDTPDCLMRTVNDALTRELRRTVIAA